MGGILGHGSIVAREYGILAVVGTGIGTQCIEHGEQITVDGDAGTVELKTEQGHPGTLTHTVAIRLHPHSKSQCRLRHILVFYVLPFMVTPVVWAKRVEAIIFFSRGVVTTRHVMCMYTKMGSLL